MVLSNKVYEAEDDSIHERAIEGRRLNTRWYFFWRFLTCSFQRNFQGLKQYGLLNRTKRLFSVQKLRFLSTSWKILNFKMLDWVLDAKR